MLHDIITKTVFNLLDYLYRLNEAIEVEVVQVAQNTTDVWKLVVCL